MPHLSQIVKHFATALKQADGRRPQAVNARSKEPYLPGIGPHTEAQTVTLIAEQLVALWPVLYDGKIKMGVPYPDTARQRCDLCLGSRPDWAIEVKMLRLLGDNGKPNDNMLMHVLSPYPQHRSALTDCEKLASSALGARKAVLIYGYDHPDWRLDPAIDAFELLARSRVALGVRCVACFDELIHPIHSRGRVFAWQVMSQEGRPESAVH